MLRFATILLLLSVSSFAAPVIEASAYCRVGATVVQSDFDCHVPGSFLSQDLTWSLESGVFQFDVSQSLSSNTRSINGVSTGETIGHLDFTYALNTQGPGRPGYLLVQYYGNERPILEGDGFVTINIGPYQVTRPGLGLPLIYRYSFDMEWLLPVTLGTELAITYVGNIRDISPPESIAAVNSISFREFLKVTAIEADGTTRTALTELPEPSTAALVALALLIGGRKWHHDRTRTHDPRVVRRPRG